MADEGLISPSSIPPPRRTWTDAEWERLRRGQAGGGWAPSVLGARVVFSRDPGQPIYSALFNRQLTGWKVVSAEVESQPGVYQPGSPEQESGRLQSVIEGIVA